MTTHLLYANNAAGTLELPITAAQTTFTLNAGQAAAFPTPGAGQAFYCTLVSVTIPTQIEIVLVTNNSSSVFTVVRGQDGTTPASFNAGDIVSQRTVAAELRAFENAAEGNFAGVALTPSTTLGIVGTTAGDNANAGSVGEYATNASSASLTSGAPTNIVQMSLTAGDWDVWGNGILSGAGTFSEIDISISLNSATQGAQGTFNKVSYTSSGLSAVSTPMVRVNVTATTTAYLVYAVTFSSGAFSGIGNIFARRVR